MALRLLKDKGVPVEKRVFTWKVEGEGVVGEDSEEGSRRRASAGRNKISRSRPRASGKRP
jgi:hypothetical protein